MKCYHVDAFAERVFEGNPAAVCVMDEWLPDELMHTSFRPWRLFKSCLRRLWLARRK